MTHADNRAWITVVTRDSAEAVQNYLYGYATLVAFDETGSALGRNFGLIRVEGDRALAYATGQAERLSSGLHFAAAWATLHQAVAHVADNFDHAF